MSNTDGSTIKLTERQLNVAKVAVRHRIKRQQSDGSPPSEVEAELLEQLREVPRSGAVTIEFATDEHRRVFNEAVCDYAASDAVKEYARDSLQSLLDLVDIEAG